MFLFIANMSSPCFLQRTQHVSKCDHDGRCESFGASFHCHQEVGNHLFTRASSRDGAALTHSWRAGSRCRFLHTRVLSENLVMCRPPSQGKNAQKLKTTCFFSAMALIVDFLHIENNTRFCEELHLSHFFLAKGNDSFWKKLKFRLYT